MSLLLGHRLSVAMARWCSPLQYGDIGYGITGCKSGGIKSTINLSYSSYLLSRCPSVHYVSACLCGCLLVYIPINHRHPSIRSSILQPVRSSSICEIVSLYLCLSVCLSLYVRPSVVMRVSVLVSLLVRFPPSFQHCRLLMAINFVKMAEMSWCKFKGRVVKPS